MSKAQNNPRAYFLISGLLVLVNTKTHDVINHHINAVMVAEDQSLKTRDIGEAQKAVQMTFFKKNGVPGEGQLEGIAIVDVVISNIMFLGMHTKDDFYNSEPTPEEMAEKEANLLKVIKGGKQEASNQDRDTSAFKQTATQVDAAVAALVADQLDQLDDAPDGRVEGRNEPAGG